MTNRESMADMSLDEQLLFAKQHEYGFCYYCPYDIDGEDCDCEHCDEGIINWLDAEFGEDERMWIEGYFEIGVG